MKFGVLLSLEAESKREMYQGDRGYYLLFGVEPDDALASVTTLHLLAWPLFNTSTGCSALLRNSWIWS